MNDSTEATHYQIELTSRQVLAALVVLLICLFAAFFSGVWIGRNAEADSAALELARVDEVARGGERFDFFSKTAVHRMPPAAAASGGRGRRTRASRTFPRRQPALRSTRATSAPTPTTRSSTRPRATRPA